MQPVMISKFQGHVLAGEWDPALSLLQNLIPKQDVLREGQFLVRFCAPCTLHRPEVIDLCLGLEYKKLLYVPVFCKRVVLYDKLLTHRSSSRNTSRPWPQAIR